MQIRNARGWTALVPGLLVIATLGAATGCDDDPTKGQAKATVSAPVAEAQPSADAAAPAVKYTFDGEKSRLEFVGAKVSATQAGSFKRFSGTLDVVGGDATKSKVELEVQTDSLQIEPEKLAGHLKSADFFDVEKFPTAKFVSTSVKPTAQGGATHTVTGNLTLHGVTKSISFPATIRIQGDAVSVSAEFGINRKDFAIVYPGMPDDLIKDEVLIKLALAPTKA